MKTKNTRLLLFTWFCLLWLCGCHTNTDDFISKYCPGSCTVIKGRLSTDGGKTPLPGVTLKVNWKVNGTFGITGSNRRKAITTTDADGNYELRFLLRDDELEDEYNAGYFTVEADLSQGKYINCNYSESLLTYYRLQRDSTILVDYILPQKAFVNVRVSNKAAIKPTDQFITSFIFEGGENNTTNCGSAISWNSSSVSESEIPVAANQQVIIRTIKRKDGIETTTEETVILTPGETLLYNAEF